MRSILKLNLFIKIIYLISMSESSDDTQLPQTNVTLPEHKSKY